MIDTDVDKYLVVMKQANKLSNEPAEKPGETSWDPSSVAGLKTGVRSRSAYRFGLDFSSLSVLPEDPKDRLEYFTAFRERIRQEQEKIKVWHRNGGGGREVIQAHTGLIDEAVRHIVLSARGLEKYSDVKPLKEFSLVAVGGYGRGELNPHSDIDLLFLQNDKIQPETDRFIQEVISIFWGIGMEIGQSCRTIKESMNLAANDLTVKTAMIETRYLIGSRILAKKFDEAVHTKVLRKNVKNFLNSKLKEKYARFGMEEGKVRQPEPDVKNGPGGLRDYHAALWAVAVRFGRFSFREIDREDVVSRDEVERLYQSVDFSLRVRNELHYLMNKKHDALSLDIQEQVAANLGYKKDGDSQAVEVFMRDYFLNATEIHNFSEHVFQKCLTTRRILKRAIAFLQKKDFGNGFYAEKSELIFEGDADELFSNNKKLLLDVFNICHLHKLDLDSDLRRQLRLHKELVDAALLREPWVKELLFNILSQADSHQTLRLMHDVEILDQLIPEFGLSYCTVNYDLYHRFTADEHGLRMVRFLEEIPAHAGNGLGDLPEVYEGVESQRAILKLACLLHSTCRMEQTPEIGPSRDSLGEIADRLKLDAEEKDSLHFLIDNFQEMMETAFHRDLHQPSVIKDFAGVAQNRGQLDLLYLISYAELRAVAPGTWTPWKKMLLAELYQRACEFLERPESLIEKPRDARNRVFEILRDEVPANQIQSHVDQMPGDYLTAAYPEDVAKHIRLIEALGSKPFVLRHEVGKEQAFHNLTLCALDKTGTFRSLIGILTAKNLDILGSQIYQRRDGLKIVSIQVEEPENDGGKNPEFWKEIETLLQKVLKGEESLPRLFKSGARYGGSEKSKLPRIPKATVDNAALPDQTVLRVEARDHPGMLYKIVKVLYLFNVQTHWAKISIQGGRGVDVFYISQNGRKIIRPAYLLDLKDNLISAMLTPSLEEIG